MVPPSNASSLGAESQGQSLMQQAQLMALIQQLSN